MTSPNINVLTREVARVAPYTMTPEGAYSHPRFLVVESKKGEFMFPGGGRDPMPSGSLEHVCVAAAREVEEELGLFIFQQHFDYGSITPTSFVTPREGKPTKIHCDLVLAQVTPCVLGQNLAYNTGEIRSYDWFRPDDALDVLTHNEAKEQFVRALKKSKDPELRAIF